MGRIRTLREAPVELAARRIVLRWARSLSDGGLFLEEGGRVSMVGKPAEDAPRLVVHRRAFFAKVLTRGEVGLGESYVDGDWDCEDIPAFLGMGIRSATLKSLNGTASSIARAVVRRRHRQRANSAAQSPRNIEEHFDTSNHLFELMLGPTMLYTCALFVDQPGDLAAAEQRKYQTVAEKLRVRPTDHVLDIGCGFGGLAIFLASTIGCRVTGISLSRAQLDLARQRVREAGLQHLVQLEYRDYRALTGTFDHIAIIGMLENVGKEYLAGCMQVCGNVLATGGRMVVDVMITPDRAYSTTGEGDSWLQRYIFPGGSTPSIGALATALHGTRLMMVEATDIGIDYGWTCRAWRENFLAHIDEVAALGFGERFLRTWRYWLCVGEAAFLHRQLSAVLAVFDRLPGPPINPRPSTSQLIRTRLRPARRSSRRRSR